LNTSRLIIREFTEQDIDIIYEINNHPECIIFNGWDSMSKQECHEVLIRWMSKYELSSAEGVFCVEEIESGLKVGMTFIVDHKKSKEYEIGFRFKRDMWGNGYAQEITNYFTKYAAEELKAKAIFAEVDVLNNNSRRIFEKLKFEEYEHPFGPEGILFS